jgi:hypothetical protein
MSLTILYFLHAQHYVQIRQRLLIDTPNHLLYFLHVQRHVHISQGLSIDIPYQYFILFTHAAPRKKTRGSRSTLHTASTTFSTRIAAYKKQ